MYSKAFLEQLLNHQDHSQQLAFRAGYELRCQEQQPSVNEPSPRPQVQAPISSPLPPPPPAADRKYRAGSQCRGLRADILRLLYTGPTTFNHLMATLKIPSKHIKASLSALRRSDRITVVSREGQPSEYVLTSSGVVEATFLVNRPDIKRHNSKVK